MKTIGLLGGMSWESTVTYYRIINETVKAKLGGLHSAQCVMWSVSLPSGAFSLTCRPARRLVLEIGND